MKKTWMRKALALVLCGVMLCAVGCTSNDDTATTTTTTQEIVTTTTTIGDVGTDDTTTTVEGVTTTIDNAVTDDTTTKNDVIATTKVPNDGKTTTTTKLVITTTSTTKKTTTTTTRRPATTQPTTKPVQTGPKVVTCYGDSVTEGMSVPGADKYPTVLQNLLGSGFKVQNAGDGGERTTCIMARQGALKLYTKKELNFKQKQAQLLIDEGTGRGVVTENGLEPRWTDPFGRDVKISNVTINGEKYQLQFANFNWSNCHCETYLVRGSTKKALSIPAGSEVILETTTVSKNNHCDIYFMGFNGTYKDIDDLIAQYQKMVDYRNDDNYLVVIPFWNKNDKNVPEAYTKFKAAFGDHALDFVQYCIDGGIEKLGLDVTAEDKECMKNSILPYSLKLYGSNNKSDVHLSAKGYKVLANALHEQGKKINLW